MDKQARFETIEEMKGRYSLVELCRIADVSRAGYYKWKMTVEARKACLEQDIDLKEHILAIHRLRQYFGYNWMQTALGKEGLVVNHKKVRRLMREHGIHSVIRKKRPFAGRKLSVIFFQCSKSRIYNRGSSNETGH
ncbi:MAG: family transposase [Bacilli bacterium]|nr:family transposase [Bacilli bacterium]